MSFASDPNPFQQMANARPKPPSIVPKIIAVVAAFFVLGILLIIVGVTVKSVGGGLAQGLYGNKEGAKKVSDVELWNEYNEDEEEATKKYGGRWVVVTGKCSEINSYRPDGSAINEQYAIYVGPRERKFSEEWLINCNIPRENVEEFNKRTKPNGIVSIRGKVVGRNSSNEIGLKDCELVSFSIK
jgi:hypothetical protein